ncbi:hypothetical protein Tam10B_1408 [Bifidobacterium vansinderenii]|uniref:Uncharacterized protein n=2 Tax=Bifidobacterium vansinderenii TaxID=1984871 RepID=A0A229VXG6_9BIFI|nr:hypothetical protein Tam10B_1408 [Bifidobacterium vansinderenii]
MERKKFTRKQAAYLRSLPAVERVVDGRVTYSESFKRHCMRRYAAGDSPAVIFREAGLDSSVIGYKRIERCIARWRKTIMPSMEESGELTPETIAEEAAGVVNAESEPFRMSYEKLLERQINRIDELEHELSSLRRQLVRQQKQALAERDKEMRERVAQQANAQTGDDRDADTDSAGPADPVEL